MTAFQTSHIGLNVTNIEQSKQFYQTIFGFEVAGESIGGEREFVLLKNGEALVLTLWRQSNGRFATNQPGLHHLAFAVDTIEEVQAVEENLSNVKGLKLLNDNRDLSKYVAFDFGDMEWDSQGLNYLRE